MKTINESQLAALEAIVNQSIKLDPLAKQRLTQLSGMSMRLECTQPMVDLAISINESSIHLHKPSEQAYNTHIKGDMSAFTTLLSANDKAAALINAELSLSGDSQPLIELQNILSQLDLDWEFHLAKLLGDLPAHLIGKMSRSSISWLKATSPIFKRHLQEFIQEEAKLSPSHDELDQFITEVQTIEERVERLTAKINKQINNNEPNTRT